MMWLKMKINVFDWESPNGFKEIMKGGGFDCVIGNPPCGADIDSFLNYFHSNYVKFAKLKQLPIIITNLKDKKQKSQHDLMVSLVDQMLATQKKLHETSSPIEKKHYQKEADILDKQIDHAGI